MNEVNAVLNEGNDCLTEDYRIYKLTKRQLYLFCFVSGPTLAFLAYLFYDSKVVSAIFLLLVLPGSRLYSKYLSARRKRELTSQFKDLLYALSASISTGRQLQEALKDSVGTMDLIYGEDSLISSELRIMVKTMEESGETEETVLREFAIRSGIKDIIAFSDVYAVCISTGADLDRVIRKTVEILMGKIELERQIQTLTSQKRFEFAILTAMPILILLFLRITSWSYISVLYETTAGRFTMTIALAAIAAAKYTSDRITLIEL